VIDFSAMNPIRHNAPPGWPADVFEKVTDALAMALVAAFRREHDHGDERDT
jgi:hypothetical protein